jgi:Bacterial membrane protein YfhO
MALVAYVVASGLLLFAAGRIVLPIRRALTIALVLLPLCFTGRALLTGDVYAPVALAFQAEPLKNVGQKLGVYHPENGLLNDVYAQMIPWRAAVRHALRQGEWPLWNPFMLCGDILAAADQPAPYYPVNLAGVLLPLDASLTFVAALTFFIAALAAFLYLREIGCSELASLVGSALWMYCGFITTRLEWPHSNAASIYPLVLLAVRRIVRRRDFASWCMLFAALTLAITGGQPEMLAHVVLLGSIYGLAELWAARPPRPAVVVLRAAGAGVVALLLTAFAFLPHIEALPQSMEYSMRRNSVAGLRHSVNWSEAGLRAATNAIWFLDGVPHREEAKRRFPRLASAYIGGVGLSLAAAGVLLSRRRIRWLFVAFAAATIAIAASAPGLVDVMGVIPLFNIALNEYLIIGAALAFAALAAFAIDETVATGVSRRLAVMLAIAAVVLSALVVAFVPMMRGAGLSAKFIAWHGAWLVAPVVVASVAVASIRNFRLALAAILFLVLMQRTAEMGDFYPTVPRRAFYPPVTELDLIPRDGPLSRMTSASYTFIPNISALYGLEDVRGYEAMTFRPLFETYPLWSAHQPVNYNRIDDLSRPFVSLMNVRYALKPLADPIPPGWKLIYAGPGMHLLQNERVIERAFIPEMIAMNVPIESEVAEMAQVADFRRMAWINDGSARDRGSVSANGRGRVSIAPHRLGYVIDAVMTTPGFVVVSETAWSGWRAFVHEREIPLYGADHAFLTFHLQTGQHRVRLEYRPRSFVIGRAISAATGLALLLAFTLRRWRRRSVGVS